MEGFVLEELREQIQSPVGKPHVHSVNGKIGLKP
jgi:hypothetical protein